MATTVTKKSISAAAAARAIRACEAKAKEIGVPMCIAVCDESGVLKAFTRMDGAALLSIQIAQDKAYTAVGFGMPTDQWYPFIKDDGPLALGAPKVDRLIIFGGGYPVKAGEAIVGAIGVSGGHYTQDMEVAKAGLAAVS
ncbi:MAG: GlcG/HbpS family heme-binding protein [Dehalococcoidia bacterium]